MNIILFVFIMKVKVQKVMRDLAKTMSCKAGLMSWLAILLSRYVGEVVGIPSMPYQKLMQISILFSQNISLHNKTLWTQWGQVLQWHVDCFIGFVIIMTIYIVEVKKNAIVNSICIDFPLLDIYDLPNRSFPCSK